MSQASPGPSSTPRRRRIIVPTEVTPVTDNDDYRGIGLPCQKCANRMFFIKDSKYSTKDEKEREGDHDGELMDAHCRCRKGARKCTYCRTGKKVCKPIRKDCRKAARAVLQHAIYVKHKMSTDGPSAYTVDLKRLAIERQRILHSAFEGPANAGDNAVDDDDDDDDGDYVDE